MTTSVAVVDTGTDTVPQRPEGVTTCSCSASATTTPISTGMRVSALQAAPTRLSVQTVTSCVRPPTLTPVSGPADPRTVAAARMEGPAMKSATTPIRLLKVVIAVGTAVATAASAALWAAPGGGQVRAVTQPPPPGVTVSKTR